MLDFICYFITGALAGIMSGLLGMGGGVIVVPGLLLSFKILGLADDMGMHMAVGSSLATMIVTATSSLIAHNKRGGVLWSVWQQMLPGIILGTILGAILAGFLPTHALKVFFAVFFFTFCRFG